MVRLKSRWLLVRVDFEPHVAGAAGSQCDIGGVRVGKASDGAGKQQSALDTKISSVSTSDLYHSVRECASSLFGLSGTSAVQYLQVLHYDPEARVVSMRVSRDACNLVRASLTFITSIKGITAIFSVIAVNGSARTAKIAFLHELRRSFKEESRSFEERFGRGRSVDQFPSAKREMKRMLKFEERLEKIRNME